MNGRIIRGNVFPICDIRAVVGLVPINDSQEEEERDGHDSHHEQERIGIPFALDRVRVRPLQIGCMRIRRIGSVRSVRNIRSMKIARLRRRAARVGIAGKPRWRRRLGTHEK